VDNIPGLPGVGEKTAKKFIKEYGSLENLLANTDKLKGKLKENIEANKELGLLSKQLATIHTNVPIEFDEEDLLMCQPDIDKVREIFNELEFRQLLENFYRTFNLETAVVEKAKTVSEIAVQVSLFGEPDGSSEIPENAFFREITSYDHLYQVVEGNMGRKLLLKKLMEQKEVCFDTETTGLDALTAELVGISFSYEPGKGYYIPFPADFEEAKEIISEFKPFFESESVLKIGHNLKYDYKVLHKYGITPQGKSLDTMIANYILNPDMCNNMDVLSETYLQYKPISIESLIGKKGKNQKQFGELDLEVQKEYAVEDADITLQLKEFFAPQLPGVNAQKLLEEIEMPLMEVLANMEIEGIRLDTDVLAEQSIKISAEILELEKKIYK